MCARSDCALRCVCSPGEPTVLDPRQDGTFRTIFGDRQEEGTIYSQAWVGFVFNISGHGSRDGGLQLSLPACCALGSGGILRHLAGGDLGSIDRMVGTPSTPIRAKITPVARELRDQAPINALGV